jgi:hypothetical protein
MSPHPVRIKARPVPTGERRPLAVELAVRAPAVGQRLVAAVVRLPHGRLRRRLVEIVAREYVTGGLNRRDFDAMRFGVAPDVELVPAPEVAAVQPGERGDVGSVVRGREAAVGYVQEWLDGWEDFAFVLKEVIDLGEHGFIALRHMHARAATSGIEIGGQEEAEYWQVRQGLVVRIQQWWSWDEALAALGLRE